MADSKLSAFFDDDTGSYIVYFLDQLLAFPKELFTHRPPLQSYVQSMVC